MGVNVAPVTLRNLLKWGVVGLAFRRNGPLQAALRWRTVFVGRPFYPLTNYLRVTVGTRSEMERLVEAFKQVAT